MYGNCVKQFKNMVLQDKIIEISGTCQSPVLAKVLPREDYMSCQVKIEDSPRTSLWVQNIKYQFNKQKLPAKIAIRNTLQCLNRASPPPNRDSYYRSNPIKYDWSTTKHRDINYQSIANISQNGIPGTIHADTNLWEMCKEWSLPDVPLTMAHTAIPAVKHWKCVLCMNYEYQQFTTRSQRESTLFQLGCFRSNQSKKVNQYDNKFLFFDI